MRLLYTGTFLITAAMLGSCTALSSRPDETTLQEGQTRIPLRIVKGLPLVRASVGRGESYWFILDTGATVAFLSKRLVEQHSLPTIRSDVWATDAHGIPQHIPRQVRVPLVTLGSLELRGFAALTLDFGRIQEALGLPVEGILGFTNFSDCLMTLDYAAGEAIFERGVLPEPNGRDVLPIRILNGVPHIEARVGETNVLLQMDSGPGTPLPSPGAPQDSASNGSRCRVRFP